MSYSIFKSMKYSSKHWNLFIIAKKQKKQIILLWAFSFSQILVIQFISRTVLGWIVKYDYESAKSCFSSEKLLSDFL